MGSKDGAQFTGGLETARVPSSANADELAYRAETAKLAVSYLTRTGNADLLEILGLDAPVENRVRRCENPDCREPVISVRSRARFCRPACATAAQRKPRKKATAT